MMKQSAVLVLLSFFLVGCSVFGERKAEEAEYSLLKSDGAYELRQYEPYIIAEITMEGNYRSTSGKAFSTLASYIFGENKSDSAIAMTTPVLQEKQSQEIAITAPVIQQKKGEKWSTAFVMPGQYTMGTVPKPIDERIILRETPATTVAVVKYSGLHSEQNIETYAEKLYAWISDNGYRAVSAPRAASFNPPWTLPFLRRNEIHIDVE